MSGNGRTLTEFPQVLTLAALLKVRAVRAEALLLPQTALGTFRVLHLAVMARDQAKVLADGRTTPRLLLFAAAIGMMVLMLV
jgi:hypothetical protein